MLISSFNLWRLFIISCPYDMTFFQPPIPWQENLTTRMSQEVRIKRRGSVGYNRIIYIYIPFISRWNKPSINHWSDHFLSRDIPPHPDGHLRPKRLKFSLRPFGSAPRRVANRRWTLVGSSQMFPGATNHGEKPWKKTLRDVEKWGFWNIPVVLCWILEAVLISWCNNLFGAGFCLIY